MHVIDDCNMFIVQATGKLKIISPLLKDKMENFKCSSFCAAHFINLCRLNDLQTVQLKEGGEAGDHREAVQLLQDGVGEQRGDEDVLHAVRVHARHQDGIHRFHQDLEQVPVWIKHYYSVFV
jgi:hypothetical protein